MQPISIQCKSGSGQEFGTDFLLLCDIFDNIWSRHFPNNQGRRPSSVTKNAEIHRILETEIASRKHNAAGITRKSIQETSQ